MGDYDFDVVIPPEEYWVGEPNLQAGYASQWSDAHSVAIFRFGLDPDVWEELLREEEEYDDWESYEDDEFCDDFACMDDGA